MLHSRVIRFVLLLMVFSNAAFAQQPAPTTTPHKYRTILAIAGAGGGFALGAFAGLNAFDDAVNSDRKVLTTAVVGAAGGAAGGYFAGRAIDNRKRRTAFLMNPVITKKQKGLQISFTF